jgi:2-isopropylmalate synthase
MNKNRKLRILDTTLREGDQAAGFSFSLEEKLRLASLLETIGVDCIEIGFPSASLRNFENCRILCSEIKSTQVAVMSRGSLADIRRSAQVLSDPSRSLLHISLPVSDLHMSVKLGKSRHELLSIAKEMAQFASGFAGMVEMGAEDATRADPDYLAEYCEVVTQNGAHIVNIADTVGHAAPSEISSLVQSLMHSVTAFRNGSALLSVHCHNDLGLANANTLAAIESGCGQIEVTCMGIGDRAGNVPLEEIAFILHSRSDLYPVSTGLALAPLGKMARELASITGTALSPFKPVTGINVRAHAAGIHQQGILRDKETYEEPSFASADFFPQRFVISNLSGKMGLQTVIRQYAGISVEGDALDQLMDLVKIRTEDAPILGITELLFLLVSQKMLNVPLVQCDSFSISREESLTHPRSTLRALFLWNAGSASEAKLQEAQYIYEGVSWESPLLALVNEHFSVSVHLTSVAVSEFCGTENEPSKIRVYVEASVDSNPLPRIYAMERVGYSRDRLFLELLLDIVNAENALATQRVSREE